MVTEKLPEFPSFTTSGPLRARLVGTAEIMGDEGYNRGKGSTAGLLQGY